MVEGRSFPRFWSTSAGLSLNKCMADRNHSIAKVSSAERCETYLFFHGEIFLSNEMRGFVYLCVLAYCFIGLSAITARFFRSMENVVKQTREVVTIDPYTNNELIRHEKVWNYAIADITLLAFGTSFPQISLATIDAIRNLGQRAAGGLVPDTLIGSAAFDLFPIHAVCVLVPEAGELKKISDLGVWLVELFWSFWAYVWLNIIIEVWTPKVITVWEALLTVLQYGLLLLHAYAQDKRLPYLSIPLERSERPEEWVPGNDSPDPLYQNVPDNDMEESSMPMLSIWRQQFCEALMLESSVSNSTIGICSRISRLLWQSMLAPWRFLFAFVPPYQIAHGWVAFICSLIFISGIAYVVTKITDLISCVTGINASVIAFTVLACGTSWPDLVASKIAAERQVTADSAIANITCSNSVNIYVGIGVPWLIDTAYNYIKHREPLYIQNSGGLGFSLIVFFAASAGCIAVLVLRRRTLGAELGGPRLWAWITAVFFMLLWIIFVALSSLKVSNII